VIEFGSLDESTDAAPSVAVSVPALRITPEEEEREIEASGRHSKYAASNALGRGRRRFPARRLHRPEIELCFQESAHPFQEELSTRRSSPIVMRRRP